MGTSILHIKTEIDCHLYLFDEEKGIAKAGTYFNLEVRKGEQDLLFVSVEDDLVRYQMLYNVEENECDYRIAIEKGQFKRYSPEVLEIMRKAEQGDSEAQFDLGRYLLSLEDCFRTETEDPEGLKWLLKSGKQGNRKAQYYLGSYYSDLHFDNLGDDKEAVKWYKMAASQGDVMSQYELGIHFKNGKGVEQNYNEAIKWYRMAAEQGHLLAMFELGSFYEYGEGVEQNWVEAAKWYRMAADKGHILAVFKLGWFYENGYGVNQDWKEAVKWYQKAANQGLDIAQFNLGVCYEKGTGVEQNYEEAAMWYHKAANQGLANAMCALGFGFETRFGNYELAVLYYRKAADQENVDAQYNLGCCYEDGKGVEQDWEEAIKWYQKAANQGDEDARRSLKKLEEKMRNQDNESLPKPPYYLFFDTETTGVPKDYNAPASNTKNWPRLVQLGWLLSDEDGNVLSSGNEIVQVNFIIPIDAVKVHGISTQRAQHEGKPLRSVIESFLHDAKQAKCCVGHNIAFDQKVVGAELYRLGLTDTISEMKSFCTMKASVDFCKIPSNLGYKYPKLQELYKKLFGISFREAHNAMSDVKATKECFFEMKQRKLI